MSYWFDPGYSQFLHAVEVGTSPDSTIRIVVPHDLDIYTYWAFYELMPRNIIQAGDLRTPGVVAVYCNSPCSMPSGGIRIAHGFLIRP